jgi:hypothetical protein
MSPIRAFVVVHRWLGIALCLLFAIWFASGAIMLYVPFPSLKEIDRLRSMPLIDMARVTVTPDAAILASGVKQVDRARLIQRLSRPVYVITPQSGPVVAVAADTGSVLPELSAEEAGQIGAAFTGAPVSAVEGPFDYDQWVVHQHFDPVRPVYRVMFDDPQSTWLYVSARSGDVLQQTTRWQRNWNYVGAVAHWLYPTILRQSWWWWDKVVWSLSLVGIAVALSGAVLGVVRSTKSIRNKRKSRVSPFRGWFLWHHVSGLVGGVVLITWIFSGWLSMDHARLFSTGVADATQIAAFRGMTIDQAAETIGPSMFQHLGAVSEVELVAVGGEAFLIGRHQDQQPPTILSADDPYPQTEFDDHTLKVSVDQAWPQSPAVSIGGIAPDDAYGHLITDPLPSSTRRVVLGTDPVTWVHVDAQSGQILQVVDRSRRLYRWLFAGLHDFDFPVLYGHEWLRQTLALLWLSIGFLLSVTGVVIGVKRLGRSLPSTRLTLRSPVASPSRDEIPS